MDSRLLNLVPNATWVKHAIFSNNWNNLINLLLINMSGTIIGLLKSFNCFDDRKKIIEWLDYFK
jgi:hypothetical protein